MGEVLRFPQSRRQHPRVQVAQPVALVHENATVVTSTVSNISAGGIQTVCDRYTCDSLHPSSRQILRPHAPHLDAHFRLPVGSGLGKLDCECRMAYITELEDQQYAIGLEFRFLTERSRKSLRAFLDEAIALEEQSREE